jgi:hypothetical protein
LLTVGLVIGHLGFSRGAEQALERVAQTDQIVLTRINTNLNQVKLGTSNLNNLVTSMRSADLDRWITLQKDALSRAVVLLKQMQNVKNNLGTLGPVERSDLYQNSLNTAGEIVGYISNLKDRLSEPPASGALLTKKPKFSQVSLICLSNAGCATLALVNCWRCCNYSGPQTLEDLENPELYQEGLYCVATCDAQKFQRMAECMFDDAQDIVDELNDRATGSIRNIL